jgi:hypothetical protein
VLFKYIEVFFLFNKGLEIENPKWMSKICGSLIANVSRRTSRLACTCGDKYRRNSFSEVTIHLAGPFISTPEKRRHVPNEEGAA